MRNIFLIARREYLEQVRSRGFRMSTIGLPVMFLLLIAFSRYTTQQAGVGKGQSGTMRITVASADPALASAVRDRLLSGKQPHLQVEMISPVTDDAVTAQLNRLRGGQIDGVLSVGRAGGKIAASYTSNNASELSTSSWLTNAIEEALVAERLTQAGVSQAEAAALFKSVKLEHRQLGKDGSVVKSNAMASFWKGYLMAILLAITTMIYGMNVARSIIQEKTSRIFEVMLAIASPDDLLAGKLLGVGAVGLTQMLIWVVAAGVLGASPIAAAALSGQMQIHFSLLEAILFPLYFLLGYLLNSALFSGLAASCETEQELQSFMPLAGAPMWLSFAMIMLVVNHPNSMWAVLGSLFPPTAPIVMLLRMAATQPPLWQIWLSVALLMLAIWVTLQFSARLYRVGILMYGKRATLPELARWLRSS
jgi:ABC-2 type transport system permease protein